MTSQDVEPYSGERLSFFQLFSQKRLQVEVPIIQRDYAQGRQKQHVVRTAFLDALHEYLKEGTPHRDLDFVYGRVVTSNPEIGQNDDNQVAGRFVPLDGQQRLTTLFLLHWYLAQISDRAEFLRGVLSVKDRSLFTYETRNSSREFCDALVANDIELNELISDENGVVSISATLRDASWFYLSWDSDPTIRSMLTMLDAIHHRFKGCVDFFELLVSDTAPVITFLFLNLQEFKLTDDLYIKMNARGKPLTYFENFKARLEKKLKSFDMPWPLYELDFRKRPVSGYEYFIHKIDTDWVDLFWSYRNETSADNTYDDELMNFIALVIANFHLLNKGLDKDLFGAGGSLESLSFMEYDQRDCLSHSLMVHLIAMFDLLHHCNHRGERLSPYLQTNPYYAEEAIFKSVIKNTTSYQEKLRFYGFYHAVESGLREDGLLSWMRVIFNLTENTIINTVDDYYRSLKSIRDLIEKKASILELLRCDIDINGFLDAQITEEKVKAHLMGKSPEWTTEIIAVEAHPFFRGQIGAILKFSGIVDYYLEHSDTDWETSDADYFGKFRRYATSASAVFSVIARSSNIINYAWERAVLTKGVYLTATTADRLNLLSTRLAKNNIERDHSWKRLLRLPASRGGGWDERQNYVKAVLDDPDFDTKDVQGSLEKICDTALSAPETDDWRWLLIKMPELFRLCNQGFIVKSNHEVLLLGESQRNHKHSELYSKFLTLEIREKSLNVSPFQLPLSPQVKGADATTYIYFDGFSFDDRNYRMDIWYKNHHYQFLFYTENGGSYSAEVTLKLEEAGFVAEENIEYHTTKYRSIYDSPLEAQNALVELCTSLRELTDD